MAHAFSTPVDPQTVLIAETTLKIAKKLEHQLQETIYVPGFTTHADGRSWERWCKACFDVKKASIQSNGGSISIRAPEEDSFGHQPLTLAIWSMADPVLLDISLCIVRVKPVTNIGVQLPQHGV